MNPDTLRAQASLIGRHDKTHEDILRAHADAWETDLKDGADCHASRQRIMDAAKDLERENTTLRKRLEVLERVRSAAQVYVNAPKKFGQRYNAYNALVKALDDEKYGTEEET